MSYQTGTATTATNLLETLVTWLVSLGWNQDRSAAEGLGWTASLDHNGNFVHLRAVENESGTIPWHACIPGAYGLHMYLGTAFDSSQPFNNQTAGAPLGSSTFPIGVGMQLSAGPFANYYFFADATADNIVVVVERTPGLFVHLGWGLSIQKAGAFTGGPYFFGSTSGYATGYLGLGANTPGFTSTSDCPFVNHDALGAGCGFVRADVDSYTGLWVSISTVTTRDQGYAGREGDSSVIGTNPTPNANIPVYADGAGAFKFQFAQTSAQDGRSNLLPIYLWVLRDGTTTGYSMLGTAPNVFWTNAVGNGFSNADEYVLGATTYKVFPNFAVVKQ
jgi:hypothetical protein